MKKRTEWLNNRVERFYLKHQYAIDLFVDQNIHLVHGSNIAKKLIEEKDFKKCHIEFLKRVTRLALIKRRPEEIKIKLTDEKNKYTVVDQTYKWNAKFGEMIFPVELIDEFFYQYSQHGLNLSQPQMIRKHNLQPWQWNSIKNTLLLQKTSNIFSPYTVENTPKDKLGEMIEVKMNRIFEDQGQLIESAYNRVVNKKYREVIKRDEIRNLSLEAMFAELSDSLPKAKEIFIKRIEYDAFLIEDLVVTVADLHIGAKVEGLTNTMDFDSDIVERRLTRIANHINGMRAKRVTLALLGDLIESFTGLNHKNSWQSMEWGKYGSEVVELAYNILEKFIIQINNLTDIIGIAGNHDRMTSDNKEDSKGEIAKIIFLVIKKIFGHKINIQFEPILISKEIDGINYIITHGHYGITNKDHKQIILDHGNNKLFNVILSAHEHSREIKVDSRKCRWYKCPPIFTGNFFSESLGFSTTPGFMLFYRTDENVINALDIGLK